MRILFLDIDGVLLPGSYRRILDLSRRPGADEGRDVVDPLRVALINRLRDVPGLAVVLSSSWRAEDGIVPRLAAQGLALPFHADWRTTLAHPIDLDPEDRSLHSIPTRGWQISRWLEFHPETTGYAILDDCADMLPEQDPHFIQTSFDEGLTAGHLTALRRALDADMEFAAAPHLAGLGA